MKSTVRQVALTVVLATAPALAGTAVVVTETIVFEGMSAPGQPPGTVFYNFGSAGDIAPPVINASGEIAFYAQIGDANGAQVKDSLWSGLPGSLTPVVLEGDQPPGIEDPNVVFDALGRRIILDKDGYIAFGAVVRDGPRNKGIWAQGPDGMRLVVIEGMTAPNTPPGHVFTSIGTPTNFLTPYSGDDYVFGGGRVAFFADDIDDGDSGTLRLRGVWSERPNQSARLLQVVARNGDDTDFVMQPGNEAAAINGKGETIFLTAVDTDADPSYNAIWSDIGGTPTEMVRGGSEAGGDASFSSFEVYPGLNDNGIAAFTASFQDLGPENDTGIWKQAPLIAGLVAGENSVAPGAPDPSGDGVPDYLFENFVGAAPLVNHVGHVVFKATVNTPGGTDPREGIWTDRNGGLTQLELIALTGQQPPGLPQGSTYTSFIPPFKTDNVAINANSDIAFIGEFALPGGATGTGIWAERDRELMLIARTGTDVHLPDSSVVTIKGLQFAGGSGNQDGRPSGFSDTGQIVYRIIGSGGILSATIEDAPPVSAPSAWLIGLAVLAAVALRGRPARRSRG